jgi:spore coat polysaccharide biosynthesis protein SpsF
MKKINVLIQARMGSTRLPGKVLLKLNGKSVLQHVVDNIASDCLNPIVLTTENPNDIKIVEFCEQKNISYFRGSEFDVLQRFVCAAKKIACNEFVRICSDSPFINAAIIEAIIKKYNGASALLSTRKIDPDGKVISYMPKGLSIDMIKTEKLIELQRQCLTDYEKEHVIPGFFFRGYEYKIEYLPISSPYNLVLDTLEDYKAISENFNEIQKFIKNVELNNE